MATWRSAVSVMFVVVIAGCSRRDDDRSIKAAPEQGAATSASASSSPAPAAPGANEAANNPLAMPLKHDGPAPAAAASAKDPCDVTEPTGALAMPLKHGAQPQKNPLCMKLK